ncbi:MAG: 4-(cytidine 5'-diphospho)-2-C-methyl-D-erythritol kinase [Endomicrobiales bacterium]
MKRSLTPGIELLAPAKINLYLEVKGRRRDGYHTIESIMQTVSLFDRITLEARPKRISLECSLPGLPADKKNLAFRAAALLKEELGERRGARIVLEKNIPLGAGLGGGSSDAAAVLKGLLILWNRTLPKKTLVRLASRLGADVPFFLSGGTAVARGIGEKLTPLKNIRKAWYILVYPGYPVSTPWVYKNLRFPLTNKQKITKIRKLLEDSHPSYLWGRYLFNRLEEVVLSEFPDIADIKRLLERGGCKTLMSGSGSTVIGLVSTKEKGERVLAELNKRKQNIWLVEAIT